VRELVLLHAVADRSDRDRWSCHVNHDAGHRRLDQLSGTPRGANGHQPGGDTTISVPQWRVLVGVFVAGLLVGISGTAWASTWKPTLKTGSTAESRAQGSPATPTSVAAACSSSTAKTIKVTWGSVTKATSYTIYDATKSASGTYTSLATGITTTTWTSGTLSAGNDWYEVAALVGSNWVGFKSAATTESTISSSGCVQP